jgi:hypothetical protein
VWKPEQALLVGAVVDTARMTPPPPHSSPHPAHSTRIKYHCSTSFLLQHVLKNSFYLLPGNCDSFFCCCHMQRQSDNSHRFASASSTNHALPIPPGRPPQRILAPVTTLDTNQARAASRPALPSHLNVYNPGPSSSPSRTYNSSPSQAVHPKTENRPLSAARQRQDAHDISGMDQRAPASAYSSLSSNKSFPMHSTTTQAA